MGRQDSYEACRSYLATLKQLAMDLSQCQKREAEESANWFQLGVEITAGEGTTPWDILPGMQPRSTIPVWTFDDPETVRDLEIVLGVDHAELFLEAGNTDSDADSLPDLPSYLWGWDRIEGGLKRLEGTAHLADPLLGWDKNTYDRNKWIYEQHKQGVSFKLIKNQLKTHSEWQDISSTQGLKGASAAYAQRANLPLAPSRQPGRHPKRN
jgi:hypothetical protein